MFKFNFDAADDGTAGGSGMEDAIPQLPAKMETFPDLDPKEFLDEMAADALFEPVTSQQIPPPPIRPGSTPLSTQPPFLPAP